MGVKTKIEWCDSTLNLMMGCAGCELYNPRSSTVPTRCYAATLTERYGGRPGWPVTFDAPAFFPERLQQAAGWSDMTGIDRPDKPWLNGRPRLIFHGDMGDCWTENFPVDWLAPYIDTLASMPHRHLFLTKRPSRMARFFLERGGVPANFWLGTSVTGGKTAHRLQELAKLAGLTGNLYASIEPLVEKIETAVIGDGFLSWVIVGGESGPNARPMHPDWARAIRDQCQAEGTPFFFKQWGEWSLIKKDAPVIYKGEDIGLLHDARRNTDFGVLSPDGEWYHQHTGWNGRPIDPDTGEAYMVNVGKRVAGRLLDDREWNECPA